MIILEIKHNPRNLGLILEFLGSASRNGRPLRGRCGRTVFPFGKRTPFAWEAGSFYLPTCRRPAPVSSRRDEICGRGWRRASWGHSRCSFLFAFLPVFVCFCFCVCNLGGLRGGLGGHFWSLKAYRWTNMASFPIARIWLRTGFAQARLRRASIPKQKISTNSSLPRGPVSRSGHLSGLVAAKNGTTR